MCFNCYYISGKYDYDSGPYNITFPTGVTRVVFNVTIIDDKEIEQNESFYIIIDQSPLPVNVFASVSRPNEATVTIVDDEQGKQKSKNEYVHILLLSSNHDLIRGKVTFYYIQSYVTVEV